MANTICIVLSLTNAKWLTKTEIVTVGSKSKLHMFVSRCGPDWYKWSPVGHPEGPRSGSPQLWLHHSRHPVMNCSITRVRSHRGDLINSYEQDHTACPITFAVCIRIYVAKHWFYYGTYIAKMWPYILDKSSTLNSSVVFK